MGREEGGRETLSQAGTGRTPAPKLSLSADAPPLCVCLNTVHLGTCGHCCSLCPGRPNSQDAISPPAVSQTLKYQPSLKKATEAKLRPSVSAGFNIQKASQATHPHGLWASPIPMATASHQQMPSLRWATTGWWLGGWATQCRQEHTGSQVATSSPVSPPPPKTATVGCGKARA